mmetsp:Transcript_83279/g.193434  ORF Transcript_83279/g.193434 Transcript_83279/m.193434 type:complete len:254 (-) Transcript_83279:780-1541(-)
MLRRDLDESCEPQQQPVEVVQAALQRQVDNCETRPFCCNLLATAVVVHSPLQAVHQVCEILAHWDKVPPWPQTAVQPHPQLRLGTKDQRTAKGKPEEAVREGEAVNVHQVAVVQVPLGRDNLIHAQTSRLVDRRTSGVHDIFGEFCIHPLGDEGGKQNQSRSREARPRVLGPRGTGTLPRVAGIVEQASSVRAAPKDRREPLFPRLLQAGLLYHLSVAPRPTQLQESPPGHQHPRAIPGLRLHQHGHWRFHRF